ncbi:hypothetical protein bsdtw1_01602 [Clostridium fungisolvens]|uniref:Uncharacterized protein n=1 Tax=Clostridium fungisolvens TaxID=1604897 RepID=A0A6V8SK33_9CLOT|nr:hypothetical protein bsdtw1_01602 [Clostridium fungisolvens]
MEKVQIGLQENLKKRGLKVGMGKLNGMKVL